MLNEQELWIEFNIELCVAFHSFKVGSHQYRTEHHKQLALDLHNINLISVGTDMILPRYHTPRWDLVSNETWDALCEMNPEYSTIRMLFL